MARVLRPDEFTVFDGYRKWSGEEILEFFHFDLVKCRVEVNEFDLLITQEGCSSLVLTYGVEINEIKDKKETNPLDRYQLSDEKHA
ncbi:MAG: hypothetical protein WC657_01895 [Candidatus Paceibacterota bacterium]|jgi:hypothetical protein